MRTPLTQAYPGYYLPPLTVLKSVLGQLVHHLLCFDELCVLFLSPWLSQGFQKKKRQGSPQWKHSVHAKTTCWGDRFGLFDISWSDSQLLWGCQAHTFPAWHFVLLLSLGSLIISPGYDNLPHDLFHKRRRKETTGEQDGERVKRNAKKPHSNIPPLPILTRSPVMSSVRSYRNICSLCCSFNCFPREHSSLYLPLRVNTLYLCVNIHEPTESRGSDQPCDANEIKAVMLTNPKLLT